MVYDKRSVGFFYLAGRRPQPSAALSPPLHFLHQLITFGLSSPQFHAHRL